MRRYSRARIYSGKSLRPEDPKGNLYYVRLKTPVGIFYKIGFTKLESVHKRFAYSGDGHEGLIDRVLVFMPLDDAFDVENRLHAHFSDKRAFGRFGDDPVMPLFKNGQSELYIEDLLGVDPDYSKEQANQTRDKIRLSRAYGTHLSESEAKKALRKMKNIDRLQNGFLNLLILPFAPIFFLFGFAVEFINGIFSRSIEKTTKDSFSPSAIPMDQKEPAPDAITPVIEMIRRNVARQNDTDIARIELQKKLNELQRQCNVTLV